jgi:mRNA-degrading endonuclease RelE of RelBE toxin-antitoxin system
MSYDVTIKKSATKDIKRLPKKVAKKADEIIEGLKENPLGPTVKKTGGKYKNVYHDRIDYRHRVFYVIWSKEQEIEVIAVKTREKSGKFQQFTEPDLPPSKREGRTIPNAVPYHRFGLEGQVHVVYLQPSDIDPGCG